MCTHTHTHTQSFHFKPIRVSKCV